MMLLPSLFFMSFLLIVSFTLLPVVVAVLLDNFTQVRLKQSNTAQDTRETADAACASCIGVYSMIYSMRWAGNEEGEGQAAAGGTFATQGRTREYGPCHQEPFVCPRRGGAHKSGGQTLSDSRRRQGREHQVCPGVISSSLSPRVLRPDALHSFDSFARPAHRAVRWITHC